MIFFGESTRRRNQFAIKLSIQFFDRSNGFIYLANRYAHCTNIREKEAILLLNQRRFACFEQAIVSSKCLFVIEIFCH